MKKLLLFCGLGIANLALAQFTSGTVSLGSTGMTIKLDTSPTTVTITLTGNSNSYLGIGAGAVGEGMSAGYDGFIYNTSFPALDYTFNGIGVTPSPDSSQDWTLVSNTVSGTTRTIVATRSLNGGAEDEPIPNAAGTVEIFFARGSSLALGTHSGSFRGYASLTMTAQLGTNEVSAEEKNIIYPNPVENEIFVKNHKEIELINFLDVNGRLINTIQSPGEKNEVSFLKSGAYFLEIQNVDGTTKYQKILKK